jgi:hypothetical protein
MMSECPSLRLKFSKFSDYSRRSVLLSSWFKIYVMAELALKLPSAIFRSSMLEDNGDDHNENLS